MVICDFKYEELQRIRLKYPKLEDMAKLFEGDLEKNHEILKGKTSVPVKFVRFMDDLTFIAHVFKFGYRRASALLGVSQAFLKNQAVERFTTGEFHFKGIKEIITVDMITRPELEKLIDVSAVAKIFGFKIRGDLSKDGKMTANLGRKGELVYAKVRGERIKIDFNIEDPRARYDFDDHDYGLVNVKTSKQHNYKDGEKFWKFSTSSGRSTRFYACVCLDGKQSVRFIVMIPFDKEEPRKSFSLSLKAIEHNHVRILWQRDSL